MTIRLRNKEDNGISSQHPKWETNMHVDADKLEKKKYSTNTSVRYKINCHERHKLLVMHFCLFADNVEIS